MPLIDSQNLIWHINPSETGNTHTVIVSSSTNNISSILYMQICNYVIFCYTCVTQNDVVTYLSFKLTPSLCSHSEGVNLNDTSYWWYLILWKSLITIVQLHSNSSSESEERRLYNYTRPNSLMCSALKCRSSAVRSIISFDELTSVYYTLTDNMFRPGGHFGQVEWTYSWVIWYGNCGAARFSDQIYF